MSINESLELSPDPILQKSPEGQKPEMVEEHENLENKFWMTSVQQNSGLFQACRPEATTQGEWRGSFLIPPPFCHTLCPTYPEVISSNPETPTKNFHHQNNYEKFWMTLVPSNFSFVSIFQLKTFDLESQQRSWREGEETWWKRRWGKVKSLNFLM